MDEQQINGERLYIKKNPAFSPHVSVKWINASHNFTQP